MELVSNNMIRTFREMEWGEQGRPWWEKNTNYPEFHGVLSLLPFLVYDSASRKQMYSSHIGQCLVLIEGDERMILSGAEEDFSKYTFSTRIPKNATVTRFLTLYQKDASNQFAFSPYQVMLYEEQDTNRVGMIELQEYTRHHPHFGFINKPTPGFGMIKPGSPVAAGTVLRDSPAVGVDGAYRFGRELNTIYISDAGVAEDGMEVSESAVRKLRFNRMETRLIRFGSDKVPVMIHPGDKIFPDLGEHVREDGLLMALRPVDDELVVCDQNLNSLREVDYNYDELVYVLPGNFIDDSADGQNHKACGAGKVIDIRVWYNGSPHALTAMDLPPADAQLMKYERSRRNFYRQVLQEYNRLKRIRGRQPDITYEFSQLIEEAYSVVGHEREFKPGGNNKDDLRRHRKKEPLDVWEVEITVLYTVEPTLGFKITDLHGGKGVITAVRRDDEMPRAADGTVAEVMCDNVSRSNRLIPGSVYEHYTAATIVHVRKMMSEITGIELDSRHAMTQAEGLMINNPGVIETAWAPYLKLIEIFSPMTYLMQKDLPLERKTYIIGNAIGHKLQVFFPTDNPIRFWKAISEVEKTFNLCYGPVSYVDSSGALRTTQRRARIAPMYYILLEKVADDASAASSGRTQVFGVLGQVSGSDKHSTPVRWNTVRAMGEPEVRNLVSYVGAKIAVDIHDRNTSPTTHKIVLRNLLRAAKPTDVGCLVDRRIHPPGNSRPHQMGRHTIRVAGFDFRFKEYTDNYLDMARY